MGTIAIMIGGAILNATAFIGGSYIEKSISPSGNSNAERKRHDLALEKYKKDWQTYQKKKQAFEAWQYQREKVKTDQALKYYNSTHEESDFSNDEPAFSGGCCGLISVLSGTYSKRLGKKDFET